MKYKIILPFIILLIALTVSGCFDDDECEDKFVTLALNTGVYIIDTDTIPNKNDYKQYDEQVFVRVNGFEPPCERSPLPKGGG